MYILSLLFVFLHLLCHQQQKSWFLEVIYWKILKASDLVLLRKCFPNPYLVSCQSFNAVFSLFTWALWLLCISGVTFNTPFRVWLYMAPSVSGPRVLQSVLNLMAKTILFKGKCGESSCYNNDTTPKSTCLYMQMKYLSENWKISPSWLKSSSAFLCS